MPDRSAPKRNFLIRLQELTWSKTAAVMPKEPPAEQGSYSPICISPVASLDMLVCRAFPVRVYSSTLTKQRDIQSLSKELETSSSGNPVALALTRKLHAFLRHHHSMLQAYVDKAVELENSREALSRKDENIFQVCAAHKKALNALERKLEENALLRLQNLEWWEQICVLTERLASRAWAPEPNPASGWI